MAIHLACRAGTTKAPPNILWLPLYKLHCLGILVEFDYDFYNYFFFKLFKDLHFTPKKIKRQYH